MAAIKDRPVAHGESIDANGRRWIDPTPNVIALVEANAKAAAQLREADLKFSDAEHSHLKEIGDLRANHASTLRISDLSAAEKTRQVDVMAATASAATLATAVQTLAITSDRNAETLRNQLNADRAALAKLVADTATTIAAQNTSAMKDVNDRIAELQKSSYTGAGKSTVSDPMQAEFIAEMRSLMKAQATDVGKQSVADPLVATALTDIRTLLSQQSNSGGRREGVNATTAAIILALGALGAITGLISFFKP